MRKIQIAISSDLCIRLTWNLTGSCSQQQRLRGWSRMVVKHFQDGRWPPFWKSIYRHISVKIILFSWNFVQSSTAADFELDERHMIINENVALDWIRVRPNVFLVIFVFALWFSEMEGRTRRSVIEVRLFKKKFLMLFQENSVGAGHRIVKH